MKYFKAVLGIFTYQIYARNSLLFLEDINSSGNDIIIAFKRIDKVNSEGYFSATSSYSYSYHEVYRLHHLSLSWGNEDSMTTTSNNT